MTRLVTTVQICNNPTSVPPLELTLVKTTKIFRGIAITGMFLVASGGAGGYTFSTSSLPAGFNPVVDVEDPATGENRGEFSGIPTTIAHNVISATVTDSSTNSTTLDFTLDVVNRLVLKSGLPYEGEVGIPYKHKFIVVDESGGNGYISYAITSGSFPAGLAIFGQLLIGTPTAPDFGISPITVTATDSASSETLDTTFRLPIADTLHLNLISGLLVPVGSQITQAVVDVGLTTGIAPYVFKIDTSTLPAGVTASIQGFGRFGIATVVASSVVNDSFDVICIDALGATSTRSVPIQSYLANQQLIMKDEFGDVADPNPATITIKSTDGSVQIDTSASSGEDTVYDLSTLGDSSGIPANFPLYDFVADFGGDPTFTNDNGPAFDLIKALVETGKSISVWMGGAKGTPAHYKMSRPLQDTGGANAQILLPRLDIFSDEQQTLELIGAIPGATQVGLSFPTPLPTAGVIIESTLSSGSGWLMNGVGPTSSGNDFSLVNVVLKNVSFRMPANPTNSCVGLGNMAACDVDGVTIDANAFYVAGVTQPTHIGSIALQLPKNNNAASTKLGTVTIVGFYNGNIPEEHTTAYGTQSSWGCVFGAVCEAGNHAMAFQRYMAIWCTYGLAANGDCYITIDQFDTENAPAGNWYSTIANIYDPSNHLRGDLRWHAVDAGVGTTHTLIVNGATNFTYAEMGAAGAGGTTLYYREDSPYNGTALTAAGGEDTITLDKSPYASPITTLRILQTVSGTTTRLLVGTDITFIGLVGSLTTPAGAGDEFECTYWATASPAATTLTTTGGTDPYIDSVVLGLHGDGTNGTQIFTDVIGKIFTPQSANTVLDTTTKKYGTASIFVGSAHGAGTVNGLTTGANLDWQYGTADFTVEWWQYITSFADYFTQYDCGYAGSGGLLVQSQPTDGKSIVYAAGVVVFTESTGPTLNTWQHYALVKDSGTMRMYRDGVQTGSASNSVNLNNANILGIGCTASNGSYAIPGYIDDVRITKGVCRYPGGTTFTPPTSAFLDTDVTHGWNPGDVGTGIAISAPLNRTASRYPASAWMAFRAVAGISAAGANNYFEIVCDSSSAQQFIGIGKSTASLASGSFVGFDADAYGYYSTDGKWYNNNVGTSYGATWGAPGDVMGVLLKNGKLYLRKNGTWQNSADPIAETGYVVSGLTGTYYPMGSTLTAASVLGNFIAADLIGSLPSGSSAWS